jgi:hypothetical protein
MSAALLPEAFADLEEFAGWILPTEAARMWKTSRRSTQRCCRGSKRCSRT